MTPERARVLFIKASVIAAVGASACGGVPTIPKAMRSGSEVRRLVVMARPEGHWCTSALQPLDQEGRRLAMEVEQSFIRRVPGEIPEDTGTPLISDSEVVFISFDHTVLLPRGPSKFRLVADPEQPERWVKEKRANAAVLRAHVLGQSRGPEGELAISISFELETFRWSAPSVQRPLMARSSVALGICGLRKNEDLVLAQGVAVLTPGITCVDAGSPHVQTRRDNVAA
jgi:hypothetical protein